MNDMTNTTKTTGPGPATPPPSTLPFDPADLAAMRVLPAEFARMVGVSKQSVSKWIKNGTVTLGPDGRLDPRRAQREYMNNTHPARVRARTLKQGTEELDELRAKLRAASERIQWLEREVDAATFRAEADADTRLNRLLVDLRNRLPEAMQAHASGQWERWADELVAVAFYGFDLETYRREVAEDEAADAGPAEA